MKLVQSSIPFRPKPPKGTPIRANDGHCFAQPYERYSAEDHAVWAELYARQRHILQRDVCPEFNDGIVLMNLPEDQVPRFDLINQKLHAATGWEIVAVSGLLPDAIFFNYLASRRFPVTWWMRSAAQRDYLEEPDLFHDLFGHVPMLSNPVFASFMQRYGELAMTATAPGHLSLLARLYWFTVEFGLIGDIAQSASATPPTLKIYGAGIVSSSGESEYSLRDATPQRIAFDIDTVLRTPYRIDSFQRNYFVVRDFAQLYEAVSENATDFAARCAKVIAESDALN